MASGNTINLRSRRGMAMVAMGVAALGAGWYFFFAQSPQTAEAVPNPTVAAQPAAKKSPTTKPNAAKPMPATRPIATALKNSSPQVRQTIVREYVTDPLGPEYRDAAAGFSVRFPDGWAMHSLADSQWVLDCGNAKSGLISIGFSPCPDTVTVDQILPQSIARRIKRRAGTELLGQGKTIIAGRKAMWVKSVGPLPMSNGKPQMTRVQYIIPLQDGRLMEVRLAAPPEKFDALSPLFRQVLETFQVSKRGS